MVIDQVIIKSVIIIVVNLGTESGLLLIVA